VFASNGLILEKGMVMVTAGKTVERKVWYKLYKKSKYDLF
jgi:hypothetical protein